MLRRRSRRTPTRRTPHDQPPGRGAFPSPAAMPSPPGTAHRSRRTTVGRAAGGVPGFERSSTFHTDLPRRSGSRPRPAASAVVRELHREVVVLRLHQLLDGLEVVALLRRDPQLLALDLRLDALGALVADELGDLLGVLGGDALLERDVDLGDLAGLARLGGVEDLQALVALDQLVLEDAEHGTGAVVGRGRDLDRLLALPLDGRPGALEVEAVRDLPGRLAERVVDLLAVQLAHDVEARVSHGCAS